MPQPNLLIAGCRDYQIPYSAKGRSVSVSKRTAVDPRTVSVVAGLNLDHEYLHHVISTLTSIGSSPLGFRNTGTPEDARVAEFVAAEMREIGLFDVAVEPISVDSWRFLAAGLTVTGAECTPETVAYQAVSFGGVPPTPSGGVTAAIVDIGDGRRTILDRQELPGKLVLLDWRRAAIHPAAVVLELMGRGVSGIVVSCPAAGPFYQSANALGGFDSQWPADGPTMVVISQNDAADIRKVIRAGPVRATMTLQAQVSTRVWGDNVVGYLPGELPGPIVVGAHHDAWFRGAFDNASGVAAMLAMAKALVASTYRPRHSICFTSRTAEEFGITESLFDWCIGAWAQVNTTHPQWGSTSPFHLCVEATGHPGLRSVIEAPVELAGCPRRVGTAAAAHGWTPTKWRIAPPVAGTEQWPLLLAGIPGVACYAWEKSFGRTDYHTQFDTIQLLNLDILAAQTRLYALLMLEADRDPDAILDHTARARQLSAIAADHSHSKLGTAATDHAAASGRDPFTRVGTSQFALDANSAAAYPHEQSQRDLQCLDSAIAALDAGDRTAAARALRSVGHHELFAYLGNEAFTAHLARHEPGALTRTWAAASHLSPVVNLWQVIACLLDEPDARPDGSWLAQSLQHARLATHHQLTQRLDAMAASLTTLHSVNRDET